MHPNRITTIKTLCEKHEEQFFTDKLKECEDYFKSREPEGWPMIKTGHDLKVECAIVPLMQECLQYKQGKLQLT